ncbi:hypothetical protein MKW92_022299, partial [Papaver armeniacum]
ESIPVKVITPWKEELDYQLDYFADFSELKVEINMSTGISPYRQILNVGDEAIVGEKLNVRIKKYYKNLEVVKVNLQVRDNVVNSEMIYVHVTHPTENRVITTRVCIDDTICTLKQNFYDEGLPFKDGRVFFVKGKCQNGKDMEDVLIEDSFVYQYLKNGDTVHFTDTPAYAKDQEDDPLLPVEISSSSSED